MIPIIKGEAPKAFMEELIGLRSTPDALVNWNEIKSRELIRESLCHEQGNLCAYCMRRISVDSSHVEHIVPQSMCAFEQDVDYGNLLAVCDGNEMAGSRDKLTCDRARQNRRLTVNPLIAETLKDIAYRKNGEIYSVNDDVQRDLVETLNLNCEAAYLPENRKAVMVQFNEWLSHAARHGDVVNACRKRRRIIEESENKPEFAGVLLYLLDRRISRGD